jgi:hypothetical protein
MNVTLMLADAVQVADGKLFILGGGWTLTGPQPTPAGIAIKIEVSPPEFDRSHHWELFLEDADGQLVMIDTPEGPQSIEVRGDFSATTPTDALPGTSVVVPMAINFGPIPLTPGQRFTWRLVIDGDSLEGSTVSFSTRPLTDDIV